MKHVLGGLGLGRGLWVFSLCLALGAASHAAAQAPVKRPPQEEIEAAVRALHQEAQRRMLSGLWAEAGVLYRKALQLKAQDPESVRGLEQVRAGMLKQRRALHDEKRAKDLKEVLSQVPPLEGRSGPHALSVARKYRMAQLALADKDYVLAEKLLREALALAPANGALRYEYAKYLSEQGRGRDALGLLEGVRGGEELLARAAYLKVKIGVAETLNGKYLETAKKLFNARGQPQAASVGGALEIDLGQVTWTQRTAGRPVVQRYTFPAQRLLSGKERYQLVLTWRSMKGAAANYAPDRNQVRLGARKSARGWRLTLEAFDDSGGKSVVEFKPERKRAAPPSPPQTPPGR